MIKKIFAAMSAMIAVAGLSLSIAPSFVGAAGEERLDWSAPADVGDATTSSTIPVPPWCDWRIGSLSETVALVPAEGEDEQYDGDAINLVFSGASINAYIGGFDALTAKPAAENCSWFGETANGAQLNVSMVGSTFAASAADGGADDGMDFSASSTNPLVTTSNFTGSCAEDGFVDGGLGDLHSGATSGTVWTVDSLSAGTNNWCTFNIDYAITIPADMNPIYGNTTYTWTGPSLLFTLQVPED
jgi:hypothetical protein